MTIKQIAVIGAGTMGNGIAQVFAASGYSVVMQDLDDARLSSGLEAIQTSLDRMLKKQRISENEKIATLAKIITTTDVAMLSDIDLVVEAASENLEVKLGIFRQLDAVCKPHAILASNTSSISLTKIAAATGRADKVCGMHFMNPVPLMALVEIIRALQTSDTTYQQIEAISKSLGKIPVEVNDSPGFVSNRIFDADD